MAQYVTVNKEIPTIVNNFQDSINDIQYNFTKEDAKLAQKMRHLAKRSWCRRIRRKSK